jgi:glycine betaine transporter
LMAIFIAKISRGRSIRSIILLLAVIAPIITNFWFTIIGGSGIALEEATPGLISAPFEGFNLPAGLLAITQALPMGFILSLLFLILTMIFVATTSDSMSFVIAASMSDENPSAALRAFWGLAMAVMALILISSGGGGVGKLQSFIVITAVPVSLVLLPSLWDALRITLMLGRK